MPRGKSLVRRPGAFGDMRSNVIKQNQFQAFIGHGRAVSNGFATVLSWLLMRIDKSYGAFTVRNLATEWCSTGDSVRVCFFL